MNVEVKTPYLSVTLGNNIHHNIVIKVQTETNKILFEVLDKFHCKVHT